MSVYIHELIEIRGHNRARYQHHMTANWVPVALEQRNQRCYGVWSTVGSTGRWPEVVNMWELEGWDGLVRNFEIETAGGRDQDPALAEWWAVAAELRRGGFDRILVPDDESRPIDQLCTDGVRGDLYCHEIVTVPPGRSPELLVAVRAEGEDAYEAEGLELVGAFRTAIARRRRGGPRLGLPELGHLGCVRAGLGGRRGALLVAPHAPRPRCVVASHPARRCRALAAAHRSPAGSLGPPPPRPDPLTTRRRCG